MVEDTAQSHGTYSKRPPHATPYCFHHFEGFSFIRTNSGTTPLLHPFLILATSASQRSLWLTHQRVVRRAVAASSQLSFSISFRKVCTKEHISWATGNYLFLPSKLSAQEEYVFRLVKLFAETSKRLHNSHAWNMLFQIVVIRVGVPCKLALYSTSNFKDSGHSLALIQPCRKTDQTSLQELKQRKQRKRWTSQSLEQFLTNPTSPWIVDRDHFLQADQQHKRKV